MLRCFESCDGEGARPQRFSRSEMGCMVTPTLKVLRLPQRIVGKVRPISHRMGCLHKEELLTTLKSGGVSMSLLDDAATFDFVVAMVGGVGTIEA